MLIDDQLLISVGNSISEDPPRLDRKDPLFIGRKTHMRNPTLLAFNILILLFAAVWASKGYGANFKVHAPSFWKSIDRYDSSEIFANTRSLHSEMVTVETLEVTPEDIQNLNRQNTQGLTTTRRTFMDRMGLKNYLAHKIESRNSFSNKYTQIESSFHDLKGRDVQMVERQFLKGGRLFVVTYLVDLPALNDQKHLEQILDNFVPNSESALESLMQQLAPKAFAAEVANGASAGGQNVASTPSASHSSISELAKACMVGVKDNLQEVVKSTLATIWKSKEYALNTQYRTQVNAMVSIVVGQFRKNPSEFIERVVIQVASAAKKSVRDFFERLTPAEKASTVCKLSTDLLAAGLLGKIMLNASLAATEAKELENLTMSAIHAGYERFSPSKSSLGGETFQKVKTHLDKRGVDTHIEEFPKGEKAAAFQGYDENENPFVAFASNKDKPISDGVIAHEAAHANNTLRLRSNQDLGAARTIEFHNFGPQPLVKVPAYEKKMRIDEVHARAVESSTDLQRAEKTLQAKGDFKSAERQMLNAEALIQDGLEMQAKSRDLLQSALATLQESRRSWTYDKNSGYVTVHVARGTQVRPPNDAILSMAEPKLGAFGIKLKVGQNLELDHAQKRAGELVNFALKDLSRFDKTFQFNREKIKRLRSLYLKEQKTSVEAAE